MISYNFKFHLTSRTCQLKMHLNYLTRQEDFCFSRVIDYVLCSASGPYRQARWTRSLLAEVRESHCKKNNLWSQSKLALKSSFRK